MNVFYVILHDSSYQHSMNRWGTSIQVYIENAEMDHSIPFQERCQQY